MDAKADLLWVLGLIALLAVAWFLTGGPNRPSATGGPFIRPPSGASLGETYGPGGSPGGAKPPPVRRTSSATIARDRNRTVDDFTRNSPASPWQGQVRLERGTAKSQSNQHREYVIVKNTGEQTVNVSGWSLKNGDDERAILTDGGYLNLRPRWVVIPGAAVIFRPRQAPVLTVVSLSPGERAIVSSGKITTDNPYPITSGFKTNLCTGYLDRLPGYNFYPPLPRTCPPPKAELGVDNLDQKCYDYVRRLGACQTPVFDENRDGYETVDGRTGFSRACQNYLKDHFSYEGCLKYHAGDPNFLGREWRLFLQAGELWRNSRESITLYDGSGRLVDRLTY